MNAVEQILDADRHRIDAMVAADDANLECYFTEDLTYAHTNGVLDTKATLIDKIRNGTYDYAAIEADDLLVKTLSADAAVLTGSASLGVRTDAGKIIRIPIRFTSVYVRDGSQWKMTAWQSTRSE
ncbi:nuclear transport factor 2 family protein [Candidatus Bipolaricaulota bacterium]